MALAIGSIKLGDPKAIERASLKVRGCRGANPMASGIRSVKLGDLEDIQTASLRGMKYRLAIVKVSRCGVGVSGWINSRR